MHNWSFDDVVQKWNQWGGPLASDCAQIALLDDEPEKQNIALGYGRKCILQSDCCLKCLAKRALETGSYGVSVGSRGRQGAGSCAGDMDRSLLKITLGSLSDDRNVSVPRKQG